MRTNPTIPGNPLGGGQLPLQTVVPSLIRTYVPLLVGQFLSWLVVLGLVPSGAFSADQQAALSAVIGAVLTGVYYTAVRLAETRWPQVGVLLGSSQQPVDYAAGRAVVEGEVVANYVGGAEEFGTQPDIDRIDLDPELESR